MHSSGNATTLEVLSISVGMGLLSGGLATLSSLLFPQPRMASVIDPFFFQTLQSPYPPSWMASTPRKCGPATQWNYPVLPLATPSLPSAGSRMAGPSLLTAAGLSVSQG